MKIYRKITGFTLIELLITVAVLAVVLAVGVPAMTGLISSNNADNGIQRLARSFTHARTEAITRFNDVLICASTSGSACDGSDWNSGWLTYIDADGSGTPSNTEILKVENISDLNVAIALSITGTVNASTVVCFDQQGEFDEVGGDGDCDGTSNQIDFQATGSEGDTAAFSVLRIGTILQ